MSIADAFKKKPNPTEEIPQPDMEKIAALIEKHRKAPVLPLKEVLPLLGGRRFIIVEAGDKFIRAGSVMAAIIDTVPNAVIYKAICPKQSGQILFDGLNPTSEDISPDQIALSIHISLRGELFSVRSKALPCFTQFSIQDEEE